MSARGGGWDAPWPGWSSFVMGGAAETGGGKNDLNPTPDKDDNEVIRQSHGPKRSGEEENGAKMRVFPNDARTGKEGGGRR